MQNTMVGGCWGKNRNICSGEKIKWEKFLGENCIEEELKCLKIESFWVIKTN